MESALRCFCLKTKCFKMPSVNVEDLQKTLEKYGQQHLLKFYHVLSTEQRTALINDIESIDFSSLMKAYAETTTSNQETNRKLDESLQPIPEDIHGGVTRCSAAELQAYREEGLKQISKGKVAVLLLAGGQGTRLGVKHPKGMYDVGLPSAKSLYQLQAERIKRLQDIAYDMTGVKGSIPWYIMTSEHTIEPTLDFFASADYFGLQSKDLFVFEQSMLPCLTFDGKVILEKPYKIAKAPDGNGGLFHALKRRGVLKDMEQRGIRFIHVYCVDNILVKMADPVFTGYFIKKKADCAAKVVEKVSPTESVGVVCRVNGRFEVVEYSEISSSTAQKRNSAGRLTFNAGNICNHVFSLDFLRRVDSGQKLKYHVAKKKIPFVNADGELEKPMKPNGIKLEKFVFDCFPLSDSFAAWEVLREDEFSPLKNADDCAKDTPTTARHALYRLHKRYVEKAHGIFIDDNMGLIHDAPKDMEVVEISPLVSYDGEDLEDICKGKTFSFPAIIYSPEEESRWRKQND